MTFLADYLRLEPAQQEKFQQVVTRLLSGDVLEPGSPLKPDPDWRFAERYRDMIDGYLRIGGWRLDIDLTLRLARVVHESGAQRARFNKLESLILCTLRLAYHEQMRQVSEETRCEVRVGELRERLIQSGKPAALLSRRILEHAIRRLARHSLVSIERGFSGEDDEVIAVSPVIEKVLPAARIAEMAERVKQYVGQGSGADGDSGLGESQDGERNDEGGADDEAEPTFEENPGGSGSNGDAP